MSIIKLSSRTRYGVRLILQIAKKCWGPISIAEIAKQEGLSAKYLEEIVRKFKKAKLVTSTTGVKGGYRLTKSPAQISLLEVIKALEPLKPGLSNDPLLKKLDRQLANTIEQELAKIKLTAIIDRTKC